MQIPYYQKVVIAIAILLIEKLMINDISSLLIKVNNI